MAFICSISVCWLEMMFWHRRLMLGLGYDPPLKKKNPPRVMGENNPKN